MKVTDLQEFPAPRPLRRKDLRNRPGAEDRTEGPDRPAPEMHPVPGGDGAEIVLSVPLPVLPEQMGNPVVQGIDLRIELADPGKHARARGPAGLEDPLHLPEGDVFVMKGAHGYQEGLQSPTPEFLEQFPGRARIPVPGGIRLHVLDVRALGQGGLHDRLQALGIQEGLPSPDMDRTAAQVLDFSKHPHQHLPAHVVPGPSGAAPVETVGAPGRAKIVGDYAPGLKTVDANCRFPVVHVSSRFSANSVYDRQPITAFVEKGEKIEYEIGSRISEGVDITAMCIILFALETHPRYRLILASNRDEFFDRPTAPAGFWEEAPDILAGRDLRGGGTWLGITRSGRFSALTNYRDPASVRKGAPSRGGLLSRFLRGTASPARFLEDLIAKDPGYNGFNLLLGDNRDLYWYSNRAERPVRLEPGIHALSNALLDTPWPKAVRGKKAFEEALQADTGPSTEDLFRLLADRTPPPDKALPRTGVPLERERFLSPVFIAGADYGTRASTVLFVDRNDRVTFTERTFGPQGEYLAAGEFAFGIKTSRGG